MARDVRYIPPSALEVAHYEPEVFPSQEVKEALEEFERGWAEELAALRDGIYRAWDELARSRGARDMEEASVRRLVEMADIQPIVNGALDEWLAGMEEGGQLFSWTLESGREIPIEERREFASRVASRYLEDEFHRRRHSGVIGLLATQAPPGVEFLHRAKLAAA